MARHGKTLREIMGLRDSIGDIRIGDTVRIVSGGHVGRVEMIGQHGLLKISGIWGVYGHWEVEIVDKKERLESRTNTNSIVSLMQWGVKEGECMNLDRFSQGLPDPQDAKVMAYCESCRREIYEGEDVYVVYGAILHADWDCLYHYVDPDFMTVEEALGLEAKK